MARAHRVAGRSAPACVLVAAGCALGILAPGAAPAQATDTALSSKPLALSLGSVKERVEPSAVRALVRYANDHELAEKLGGLSSADSFYVSRRKFDFDVTDQGTFGGVAVRYGVTRISGSTTRLEGLPNPVFDSAGWIHTVPVTLGLDADRSFKNRDWLLEAGWVPFRGKGEPSCFKVGGNPIVGLVAQVGGRTREQAAAGFKRELQRLKVELKSAFEIGRCFLPSGTSGTPSGDGGPATGALDALAADIAKWRVSIEAQALRDFVDDKNYRYAALTLRMPAAGKDSFIDVKRETGSTAPNFKKGSQYGLYLTVQY